MLPHAPFIQIPGQSTRRSPHSQHFRLHRATAGSFQWPNLAVAASHPTAGQDQQCLSTRTWMKFNSKLQSPTLYDLLCFRNNVWNRVSWIHSVHFEVANMPNIPTHSPEIRLRRKFSCLSARVVWPSSVSAMIAAASCSPQFSICISLAPLRSSASASPFLSGVPHNQHHHHHSSSRSKKRQQPSFLEGCFVAGFKDTTPLPNIVSIVCQGKGNCSRNWKQQSKKTQ